MNSFSFSYPVPTLNSFSVWVFSSQSEPEADFSWYISIFNYGPCCYDVLDFRNLTLSHSLCLPWLSFTNIVLSFPLSCGRQLKQSEFLIILHNTGSFLKTFWIFFIYLYSPRCNLEDLTGATDDRDGLQMKVSWLCSVKMTWYIKNTSFEYLFLFFISLYTQGKKGASMIRGRWHYWKSHQTNGLGLIHCSSKKKNGDVRICVDLKKLNSVVKGEHFMLLNLENISHKLRG